MNVLEGLWSAHARSSPVSSPPVQFSILEIPPYIFNRNRNRKEEINMHSQRKEIGSLSAYRVLDAREIRELNSEGFVLEHKKTGAMPGTDRMALLAASAVSMVSFSCEAIGDGGYGTYKWKLLDALSQPDLDLYEAYIGRNMKWIC